tara:strand:- start:944 stop:1189 length:246 start_codon:yes stop_codon:yes gene_type:complete
MSNEVSELIEQAIIDLSEDSDIQELIQTTEAAIKTTKEHYGEYLSLLSNIKDKNTRYILSQAFIRAGANTEGVKSAMKIIG